MEHMKDKEKTKEQLIEELRKLNQKITELEKSEIHHQEIEEALTENEEKYRMLVECITDGVFIETVEGRILECNTAGAKIYGYPKKEMIGLSIKNLVPEEFSKQLPKIITPKETTKGIFVPRISKRKDGSIFPTEIATKIVRIEGKPRLIVFVRDITKRKEAERKLRKARKMFASLFNSSPIAALHHDKEGRILNINPYFTQVFGYTLKEIKGKNIDEGMIYPKNRTAEGERLTKNGMTPKGISQYESIRKKKDGTLVPVLISSAPVIIDKKVQGTIALYQDITERKKAEDNLKKSQQEFISLFNNSPEALVYLDGESNVVNINSRFNALFGYTLEEIKGRNINDGMIHPPNKRKEGKDLVEIAISKGYLNYETIRKKKDGTLFPVSISASRVMLDDKVQGTIGMYRDITERKQDEQLHQVLYNISKATNSTISLDQLYPLIHRELNNIIDATNFFIALIDIGKDEMSFPYHKDEKDNDLPTRRLSQTNNLTAYVIKYGQSLLVNQKQIEKMGNEGNIKLEHVGIVTANTHWLGVPLKVKNKTIGAMVVQRYIQPYLFSKKDIKLMEFVSEQVATAVERKKAEETLRESQQEFSNLFINSPEALVYMDEKGNILNINPRFTELFGYQLEEVKGKNIDSGIIHNPAKVEEGKKLTKRSLKGYFNYETLRKRKDGTFFPVSISAAPIEIDGQIKALIATYIDITERKMLEERLEKLAYFDVLTGCYARGYGLSLFERQIKTAQRHKIPILLLYIDLDGLKYINDTFGHKVGDKALNEAVNFFKSNLRKVDIISRVGGDEFLLIFPDSSLSDVPLIKKRINNKLKEFNKNLNAPYKIGFSLGFSCYNPSNPLSIEELIKIADENMYEDKARKKRHDETDK